MSNGQKRPRPQKPHRALWLKRRDQIRSICFDRIAREIDADRARDAGKSPAPDQRANGPRMRRVLLAIHQRLGKHAYGVIKMEFLALDSDMSERNARRGVADLEAARIIHADRKRERVRRLGGRGPSGFAIAWSTVADLALTQGVQHSLFDDPACDSQPDGSAVFSADEVRLDSIPRTTALSHDTGQLGRAPGQLGRAPGQNREPNARARASFPTSFTTSSSPSAPEDPLSCPAPFTQAAEPLSAQSKKKKFLNGEDQGPQALADRLERYGIYFSRRCAQRALERGWSVLQVTELLDRCEALTVVVAAGPGENVTLFAWPPPLVYTHLSTAPAGSSIDVAPCEAYVRARRDRDLRLAREREQTVRQAEAQFAAEQRSSDDRLRDEAEALLAGLPADEVAALREQLLSRSSFLRKQLARGGEPWVRRAMIEELSKKARAIQKESP